ncbi:MAG: cation:proton antiporter, partial [Planctomycetota bacterium]
SVLKELERRGLLESVPGGHAVGILLVQDLAVIPFVLVSTSLVQGGEASGSIGIALAKSLGLGLVASIVLYGLLVHVVPRLLGSQMRAGRRELSILSAVVAGLAGVLAAHEAGFSPALGAFIAGMLLASSPYAVQIRADMAGLRTLFVTIFFSSIGAFGDPLWMLRHGPEVLGLAALVIVLKTALTTASLRFSGARLGASLAAGLSLAQIGEFAFLLAGIGRGTLLGDDAFLLLVSVALITILCSPALIGLAPVLATRLAGIAGKGETETRPSGHPNPDVILVGFGPAGLAVGEELQQLGLHALVLDINPAIVLSARKRGFEAMIGDAMSEDVLHHAGLLHARALVLSIPTTQAASHIITMARHLAPDVWIVARSRFHRDSQSLRDAGAHLVVDEEVQVGHALAQAMRALDRGESSATQS